MSAVPAHIESVSVTATDTAATAADKIDGLSDASLSRSSDLVETNYLGAGGFKKRVKTMKDHSGSLSGHFLAGDLPQKVLRDAYETGATVYVTFVYDSSVTAGQPMGERIPMIVESYDEKHTSGGLIEFSCSLQGNGAPTVVNAGP